MAINLQDPKVLAVAGTAALLALAGLFVSVQAPAPPPPPGLDLEAALSAPTAPAAPTPPQAPAGGPQATAQATSDGAAKPSTQAKGDGQAPPTAALDRKPPPTPHRAAGEGGVLDAAPVGESGYRLRFASVSALQGLEADEHLQIIVQTPAGTRYRMPVTLKVGSQKVQLTEPVDEAAWAGLLAQGTVQRLSDDLELRRAVGLRSDGYVLYAVLEPAVIEAIHSAAAHVDADARRSVLLVDRGPSVAVALARR